MGSSISWNCVDRKLVGFPPIPQKKTEWMGHGSLQKSENAIKPIAFADFIGTTEVVPF
jgi:hypothetical protein